MVNLSGCICVRYSFCRVSCSSLSFFIRSKRFCSSVLFLCSNFCLFCSSFWLWEKLEAIVTIKSMSIAVAMSASARVKAFFMRILLFVFEF